MTPSANANSPRQSSAWKTALAYLFAIVLASAHGWAIWLALEGWEGINGDWPLWRDDHPLYFHSALVTRDFLRQSWTTAGYDPAFMSGYAKSVVFPASSTLPELSVALFGGDRPQVAYKIYVFLAAALIPWLIGVAAIAWRSRPIGVPIAVAAFLIYVWTDFPINYAAFGMLPYLLAIPLGLLAAGVFARYAESGGISLWLASAVLMSLVVLVHFTSAMIVVPAAALVYFGRLVEGRSRPETRLPRRRQLGIWLIPVVVLLFNAFWWWPGPWLSATKGASDFAFAHPEGVVRRLLQIATTEPAVQRWLWAFGLVGLISIGLRGGTGWLGLLGFATAGFFWGYLAGGFRSLDFLQPGRHTFACYSALAVATGLGLGDLLERLRRTAWFRLDLIATGLLLGVVVWTFRTPLDESVRARVLGPLPFLSSRPSPVMLWVMSRVKRHVTPGERLFYEEGGFAVPGAPEPFQGGRFSGLLPWKFGVEVIGGPYLHAALTTNFSQFGEGQLFGKADWDRDWFERYARLYRPSAILCWSPKSKAFCRSNPDLIQIQEDNGLMLIGRVRGFEGAAIEGRAEVEAKPGRLVVKGAEGGVDGLVILRYHSVPCLRSDPAVAWEPVLLEGDPVPFIKLRPTPGRTTFTLSIPPGSTGTGSSER